MNPYRQELSQIHDRNGSAAIILLAAPLLAAVLSLVPLRQTGETLEQSPAGQPAIALEVPKVVKREAQAAAFKLDVAIAPESAVSDEKAAALARLVAARADDVVALRASVGSDKSEIGDAQAAKVPALSAPIGSAISGFSPRPKILGTVPAARLDRATNGPTLPATIQLPVRAAKSQPQVAQAAAQARRHAASPAGGTDASAVSTTKEDVLVIADEDLAKRAASLFAESESGTAAVKTDTAPLPNDTHPAPITSAAAGSKKPAEPAPETTVAPPAPADGKPLPLTRSEPVKETRQGASPSAKPAQPTGWVVRRSTADGVSEEALDSLGRAPVASTTPVAPATAPSAETGGSYGSAETTTGVAPRKVAAPAGQDFVKPEERVTALPSRLPADGSLGVAAQKMQAQILFQKHSATLTPQAQADLTALAQRLLSDGGDHILLLGYSSDEVDSASYSTAHTSEEKAARARLLSLSRTIAVRRFLMGRGVPSHRLFGRALGSRYASGPANRVDIMLGRL